ncbi:MAG: DUF1800 family protein, partial [Bacteroidota bacterium]
MSKMEVSDAVASLFDVPAPLMIEPISRNTGQPWINSGIASDLGMPDERKDVVAWWIQEATYDSSIRSKMTFFLHSIFVTEYNIVNSKEFYDYLGILRYHALGNIKECAKKITVDNLMLKYLDGQLNSKNNPNENYAREFFELFTIGKGEQVGPGDYTNYTEEDIVTAAKLLTGFRRTARPLGGDPDYWDSEMGVQLGKGQYSKHDTSDKTFSYAFGGTTITGAVDKDDMFRELDDFVEMVFGQIATARNICRKLYRFFVSSVITPEIESDIIEPLADTLFEYNYELQPTLTQLLNSLHFYDRDDNKAKDNTIGSLVKSPLELLTHTIRFFDISIPDPITNGNDHYNKWYKQTVQNVLFTMGGLDLFMPESVAGYPAYYQEPNYSEYWFNSVSLIPRYKLPEILLKGQKVLVAGSNGGVEFDIVQYVVDNAVIKSPEKAKFLVKVLCILLFPEAPKLDRLNYFLNNIFLDDLSELNWYFEWLNYEATGDDTNIRIP